jgi:hypothetical protein
MKRFTISIPKELKDDMDEMSHINWPEIAKKAILHRLSKLEKFEVMTRKGEI